MDPFNQTRWRALELARTGLYRDCDAVKRELAGLGFSDAHAALEDQMVRRYLRRVCHKASEHRSQWQAHGG
jgi:hypothetical protein